MVVTVAKLICGDGSCFDGTGLTVDVERPLTADEQASYYDYTLDTDPQIQRAVSCAQLTGVTTVGGVNDADIAADSAAASSEAAAGSTASGEAAGEAEASSEVGAEGGAGGFQHGKRILKRLSLWESWRVSA